MDLWRAAGTIDKAPDLIGPLGQRVKAFPVIYPLDQKAKPLILLVLWVTGKAPHVNDPLGKQVKPLILMVIHLASVILVRQVNK